MISAVYIQLAGESFNYAEAKKAHPGAILINPLPREGMTEALARGKERVAKEFSSWIEDMEKKKANVKAILSSKATKEALLKEMVRFSFSTELACAYTLPESFWDTKLRAIGEIAKKYSIAFDQKLWAEYLLAVDERSKRMLAKREREREEMRRIMASPDPKAAAAIVIEEKKKAMLAKKEREREEAKEEIDRFLAAEAETAKKEALAKEMLAKRMALSSRAKRSSLKRDYIKVGAQTRVTEKDGSQCFVITAYSYLYFAASIIEGGGGTGAAMTSAAGAASAAMDRAKLIKLEEEILAVVINVRAGFTMNKEALAKFIEQTAPVADRLRHGAGTILVHRPDGTDTSQVDAAIKGFLAERGEALEEQVAVWNPDVAEEMREKRTKGFKDPRRRKK